MHLDFHSCMDTNNLNPVQYRNFLEAASSTALATITIPDLASVLPDSTTFLDEDEIEIDQEGMVVVMCDSSGRSIRGFPRSTNLSTGIMPAIDDFPGDLKFELLLDHGESSKKKWIYSKKLKKVFIDIDQVMCIHFRWDFGRVNNPLFIRALPVYTQDDWLRIPVERCPLHVCSQDTLNSGFPWISHVLRCLSRGTKYEMDNESSRRSCVTPITKSLNSNMVSLNYKFVCKTSCYKGMQRRPIVVIFTLEDVHGTVVGRRSLMYKICSCLKRDKSREEKDLVKTIQSSKIEERKRQNNDRISMAKRAKPNEQKQVKSSKGVKKGGESTTTIKQGPSYDLEIGFQSSDDYGFALTTMHNSLVGATVRNQLDSSEDLMKHVEGLLDPAKTFDNSDELIVNDFLRMAASSEGIDLGADDPYAIDAFENTDFHYNGNMPYFASDL